MKVYLNARWEAVVQRARALHKWMLLILGLSVASIVVSHQFWLFFLGVGIDLVLLVFYKRNDDHLIAELNDNNPLGTKPAGSMKTPGGGIYDPELDRL